MWGTSRDSILQPITHKSSSLRRNYLLHLAVYFSAAVVFIFTRKIQNTLKINMIGFTQCQTHNTIISQEVMSEFFASFYFVDEKTVVHRHLRLP